LAVILLLAAGGGILGMFFLRSSPPEKSADAATVRYTLHLDTFVVNLLEPEEKAYLRVGVDVGLDREFANQGTKTGPPVSEVRDTVLEVLAACRAEELLTADGKRKLKEQILASLRGRIPELGAREIYFTEFLIQR
jgi:flagellar basal body-associated protein FliL